MAIATAVVNTTAGFTDPIQWTETAGGTIIEWYTDQLQATTLAGVAVGKLRALESDAAANTAVRLEIAITDSTGDNVRIWGAATSNTQLTTSEATYYISVTGPDLTIDDTDRIRFRIYIDDFEAAMGTGYTATAYYDAATPDGSGDTYVMLPIQLQAYITPPVYVDVQIVGVQFIYTISGTQYSYVGGINTSAPVQSAGRVWITDNYLCYSDINGVTRLIAGATDNITSTNPVGSIYVYNNKLRWVGTSGKEYVLMDAISVV